VLDLGSAKILETSLVTDLGEAKRIEVSQRGHSAELIGWLESSGLGLSEHGDTACLGARWKSGELSQGVLASGQLSTEDAQHTDHGHAAVVDLLHPHILSVLVDTKRVAEVARVLSWLLLPDLLEGTTEQEDDSQTTLYARFIATGCGESTLDIFKAREAEEAFGDGTNGSHHGHTPVLELGSAQILETSLIADLREAKRIEVS